MTYVFISYSRKDIDFVLEVVGALKAESIEAFIDQRDIRLGTEFAPVIQDAIERCTHMLVILSPASDRSPWVEREMNVALQLKKEVIPVLYKNCELSEQLKKLNYADLRANRKAGLKRLCAAIRTGTGELPKTTVLQRFLTPLRTVAIGTAAALSILLAVYFLPESRTSAVSLVQGNLTNEVQVHLKNSGGWPSTVTGCELRFNELPIEDTMLDLDKARIVGRHSTLDLALTKHDGFAPKNGLTAKQIAPGKNTITLVVAVRESDGAKRLEALTIPAADIWPFIAHGLPTVFLGVAHVA